MGGRLRPTDSQLKVVKEKGRGRPKMSKSQNPTKEVIPIMKKRIYRRMPVNDFQPQSISHADLGGKLVFAIDVAKVDMVAAFNGLFGSHGRHHFRELSSAVSQEVRHLRYYALDAESVSRSEEGCPHLGGSRGSLLLGMRKGLQQSCTGMPV